MKSAEHLRWDLELAAGRARADAATALTRLTEFEPALRRAVARMGVTFAEAVEGMRKTERALARIDRAQAEERRRKLERFADLVEETTGAPSQTRAMLKRLDRRARARDSRA